MNTIQFTTPPQKALQALNEGLTKIIPAHHPLLGAQMEKMTTNDPAANYAHPVYTISLANLKDGKGIEGLILVGWRYILEDASGHPYSVEAAYNADKDNYLFSEINHGPFPNATKDFLTAAAEKEGLKNDNFELRVVRIPGIYVFALWLHGASDLFAVLEPADKTLQANQLYTTNDFFAALKSLANKRLSFED